MFGLTALIILGFYFLSFRSVRGVVLPFLVVVLGTVWSMGFMALLGYSLTIVNIIIPPLVLTLGSSYSIHLLNQYYRGARGTADNGLWLVGVVEHVSRTIMFAAATTIVGFLSLLVTDIRQTREFALAAGFGITASALLSLIFLPALLSRLSPPPEEQAHRVRSGAVSRSMVGLSRFDRVLSEEGRDGGPEVNLANDDFSQLRLSFRIYNARTKKFIDEQSLRAGLSARTVHRHAW